MLSLDNSFISWIDKKDIWKWVKIFLNRNLCGKGNVIVELDLSNYATKADLKSAEDFSA